MKNLHTVLALYLFTEQISKTNKQKKTVEVQGVVVLSHMICWRFKPWLENVRIPSLQFPHEFLAF